MQEVDGTVQEIPCINQTLILTAHARCGTCNLSASYMHMLSTRIHGEQNMAKYGFIN
jgi:hypothetical protein